MKILIVAILAGVAGFYLGSQAMQQAISDKFAQGEGKAICESVIQAASR